MSGRVSAFLAEKKSNLTDLEVAQKWAELEELYNNKLWHQLTEELKEFVKNPCFKNGGLLELYNNFLSDFEHKLNSLSLMEIVLQIIQEFVDADKAVDFLEAFKEKVKNNLEARVLCLVAIGNVKLSSNRAEEVKVIIEQVREELDNVAGVTEVHGRYYDLASQYYQVKGDHAAYYRDALRYLGCVDLKKMSNEEKMSRAFSLSLAALIGEGIFNFGELLGQEVIDSLAMSDDKFWVVSMLEAFNEGNLKQFESLKKFWTRQPDLSSNVDQLNRKIRLLCLMELVFRRHAHERTIDFQTIAEAADVPIDEVEMLVMKALSLGLVKGTIDEVDKQVSMTWVQPRVLDKNQVTSIRDRVVEWCSQVKTTILLAQDGAPDVVSVS